jgi:GDSL-like Lipase/Acylhydrolase family
MGVRTLAAAFVVALLAAAPAAAEPAVVGYPSSMASTGDSITRAFNLCFFPFTDCPSASWSTGTNTTVNSHYRRILAARPAISGRNFNDAVSGADMADFNAQAQRAVAQGAQYVTALMGANDVCASSEAGVTDPEVFEQQFRAAMATLSGGLPDARIYVVSIPRVYRLWSALRGNASARFTWTLFGICQSMLANPGSTAPADEQRRLRVDAKNAEFNVRLAEVCSEYVHCRFDNNTVFNYPFTATHVSSRDYFHPSIAGQTVLSAETWRVGFNFTDNVPPSSSHTFSAGVVTLQTSSADAKGIEYRLNGGGWTRYTAAVPLPSGSTITWRAVDVNGNAEATQSLTSN